MSDVYPDYPEVVAYHNPNVLVMLDPEENEFCLVPKPGGGKPG